MNFFCYFVVAITIAIKGQLSALLIGDESACKFPPFSKGYIDYIAEPQILTEHILNVGKEETLTSLASCLSLVGVPSLLHLLLIRVNPWVNP